MLGNHCIARGAVIFVKNNTEAQEISEPLCFRLLLAKPDSYFLPLTSYSVAVANRFFSTLAWQEIFRLRSTTRLHSSLNSGSKLFTIHSIPEQSSPTRSLSLFP